MSSVAVNSHGLLLLAFLTIVIITRNSLLTRWQVHFLLRSLHLQFLSNFRAAIGANFNAVVGAGAEFSCMQASKGGTATVTAITCKLQPETAFQKHHVALNVSINMFLPSEPQLK